MKVEQTTTGVQIRVKVVPNSSRDQVVGMLGGALKVKVAQPPEGGKANRAVEALLAGALGVAKTQVSVVAGETWALKTVRIVGISASDVLRLIEVA